MRLKSKISSLLKFNKISINKKAEWGWEVIGKIILILIVILVLLIIIGLLSGKSHELWDKIAGMFSFGG